MAVRQLRTPNLGVPGYRGWCLKFVDDAVNAPSRQRTAQLAFGVESRNGNTRTSGLPVGIWVPIWFSLSAGPYAGLGHVAWAFNHGNGVVEIHDSETASRARAPYRSIAELLAWFRNHGITYLGWSTWVDGVRIVEEYTPSSGLKPTGRIAKSGTARVVVDVLNVRNSPSTGAGVAAQYRKGQIFNYDSYQIANGYVWLSYVSYSGVRRYVAEGPANGDRKDVYVTGGIS